MMAMNWSKLAFFLHLVVLLTTFNIYKQHSQIHVIQRRAWIQLLA